MGMVLCGVAGIARSFAPSYIWFIVLEFVDAMFGAGTYACGFILGTMPKKINFDTYLIQNLTLVTGVELVGPEKRVLSGTIISSCYAVGEVLTAGVAWAVKSWR